MDHFGISATGHSLNYLPHYVAVDQGFFAEVGLEVSTVVPSPWDKVLDDIASGKALAALGGIWVPSMHHGRGMRLVPFAQVSARPPLALIGRQLADVFSLPHLIGKVVAMKGSSGASAGVYLKMLLREAGLDPRKVDYIQDLSAKMLARCFAGGMADYLLIDLPGALAFEAQGHGHVVAKFAVDGGQIPWSVYYTWNEWAKDEADPRSRFVKALKRGMDWVNSHDADSFRPFLTREFPGIDPEISVATVNLYRATGMWTTPRIDADAYARWQCGISDARLIEAPIAYEALIDAAPTSGF